MKQFIADGVVFVHRGRRVCLCRLIQRNKEQISTQGFGMKHTFAEPLAGLLMSRRPEL